jgi:hypothetical protein
MSFLKRLFGLGGGGGEAPAKPEAEAPAIECAGHVIRATPYKDGGQWQLCGLISKTIDGVAREHRFVRADRFADRDTAIEMAFVKGRLIVEQLGDRLYD